MVDIDRADVNWEAVRAEYVAGDLSQAALVKKYGVSAYALRKRAGAEGWAKKKARGDAQGENAGNPVEADGHGVDAGAPGFRGSGRQGPCFGGGERRECGFRGSGKCGRRGGGQRGR